MFASEWLEVGAMFGSIVGVWFALVGWKLVPRSDPPGPAGPCGPNRARP
jgi:hypothetical protein